MNTKNVLTVLLTLLLILGIGFTAAAGGKQEEAAPEESTEPAGEAEEAPQQEAEEIVIGISKFVQHPALDAVEQGIDRKSTRLNSSHYS